MRGLLIATALEQSRRVRRWVDSRSKAGRSWGPFALWQGQCYIRRIAQLLASWVVVVKENER